MPTSPVTCFRRDFIVTCNIKNSVKQYTVKNHTNDSFFEFGEEKYFLCQSINGTSTPSQIVADFKSRFDLTLTEADLQNFLAQIENYGLLKIYRPANTNNSLSLLESGTKKLQNTTINIDLNGQNKSELKPKQKNKTYIWLLPDSTKVFKLLSKICYPLKPLFQFSTWALIPG